MMKRKMYQKVKLIFKKIRAKDKGAALVVSLLVLMVLVLLGLTLILQSQTEYLGAVNENDSLAALSYAESALEWAEREIKDKASDDLDPVLGGPFNGVDDGGGTGTDDNLIGIRNLSNSLTLLSELNSNCPSANCEQTESVKVIMDWDGDGNNETYEAFRTGTDTNGDGVWDGPRAHMYVRMDDNFDNPSNDGIMDRDDHDLRARIRVMSEYPIFVDSNGVAVDPVLATRGIAIRKIEGRLAPLDNVAVVVNKLLDAEGNHRICGACGSIHSNGDMNFSGGTGDICVDATASGDYDTTGATGGPNVGGESGGGFDERPVPIINPYRDVFVPSTDTFDHSGDSELSLITTAVGTALQCPPPSATDPGSSKYFAFVVGLNNVFRVYKGYPDFAAGANRWLWRLIDQGPDLTAVLDNCGRVVSTDMDALGADLCPAAATGCDGSGNATYGVTDVTDCCGDPYPGDGLTYCHADCIDPVDGVTNRCVPDGQIDVTCDDPTSGDAHFYGFSPGANYDPQTCAEEDSLIGTSNNDFTTNDFWLYPSGQNNDANFLPLPGGDSDGEADWDYTFWNRFNRWKWDASAATIFSPMQNSIVFVVGNLDMNGDMTNDTLQFYDHDPSPGLPGTYSIINPLTHWRISPIAYGRVDINGTWIAPANSVGSCLNNSFDACHLGAVAGRDIELRGGAGSGCAGSPPPNACNLCPDLVTDPNLDCESPLPVVPVVYAGYFMAHEQVSMRGNSRINGFVIAEEASYCAEWTGQMQESNIGNGNPSIYYDCNTPPNPFEAQLLRITSWEEVQ